MDLFKLCIVAPNFNGGGAERIAVNLANEYTGQGHDVTLLVIHDAGPYRSQLSPKVRLEVVGLNRGYKVLFYLIKYFRQKNYTHVLSVLRGTNVLVGLALWFKLSSSLIFREANELNEFECKPFTLRVKELLMMRLAYFRAQKVIANACKTKQDLIDYRIASDGKIAVIHNPVLSSLYNNKMQEDCIFEFDSSLYYFLNIGRFHYQKNQALLIRAFAKVLEYESASRLVLVGEGGEEENLKALIDRLNLHGKVFLVPFQSNPFPFYKKTNCFVLSSRWEGFGNVIVEALAAGTPVISTACGGPQDILQHGKFGVLVEKENEQALADAMVDFARNKHNFLVELLEQRASEFTVENKAREYLELIKSI